MKNLDRFLEESNAIEGVYDRDSFVQAKLAWEYCLTEEKLTPGVILKTHKILMLNQKLKPDEKGYFRKIPIYIGNREGLHYSQISEAMGGWCHAVNANIESKTPSWKQKHVVYEVIHPFVDGNGRSGRIFMNWQRVKTGQDILVIDESKKQDYYDWFRDKRDPVKISL